jgi:hypothetical protein
MAPRRRTQPPRPPAGPPDSIEKGADAIRKAAVKLYDRQDGNGVDWSVLAEVLFKTAFDALDRLPDSDKKAAVARRVHAGAYERFLGASKSDTGESKSLVVQRENAPSITGVFTSSHPRPPK